MEAWNDDLRRSPAGLRDRPRNQIDEEIAVFKHVLTILMLFSVLTLGLSACGGDAKQTDTAGGPPAVSAAAPASAPQASAPAQAAAPAGWSGEILETMNSGGYTYILLDTGSQTLWAAAPETQVAVGQRVNVPRGMMMKDFPSSTLDRTFPEIWFVSGFMPADEAAGAMPAMGKTDGGESGPHNVVPEAGVEAVAKAAGGHDIAGVYAHSAELGGAAVKVRGRVVKFTSNIMGTNWVHIQDGTGVGPTADLTVTTGSQVSVGDVVLVEGPLSVNKDFGAGYKYAVIIENATVTKE